MESRSKKESLRKKAKSARLGMSRPQTISLSERIADRVIKQINWPEVKSVHIYSPIPSLNEVNTLPIVTYLRDTRPDIRVFIEAQSEPKTLPPHKFDLIIVPTLAFDNKGNRLGWGGGFYDKLLAMQPQATKIGLAYQASLVKEGIPNEEHDIPLNQIITEEGSYAP